MRAVHHRASVRDIRDVFDKDDALTFEVLDHPLVVNDGVADIERRTVDLQG